MLVMGHIKTYTHAMAEAGHKYMKDIAWKKNILNHVFISL